MLGNLAWYLYFFKVAQAPKINTAGCFVNPCILKFKKEKGHRNPFALNTGGAANGTSVAVFNSAITFYVANGAAMAILNGSIAFNVPCRAAMAVFNGAVAFYLPGFCAMAIG